MKKIPFVSSLLKRSMQGDVEKGNNIGSAAGPQAPQTMSQPTTYAQTDGARTHGQEHFAASSHAPLPIGSSVHEYVGTHDRLAHFRRLVGIDSAPTLTNTIHLQRKAPNVGIYTRTVSAEANCGKLFKVFSLGINSCLGLQIVVAATLTALGAAGGGRAAVTVFGAINTVIAGFLTYLKGSGLPNRFKYFESEWRKVREYIEQREREFGVETCTLSVEEEARVIELMYENVRADVEANVPDSYTSVTRLDNGRVAPLPAIGDPRRMTVSTLNGFGKGFEKEADRGHHGLAKGLDTVYRGIEKLDSKIHHHTDRGQQGIQHELERGQQTLQGHLSRSQSALESSIAHGQRTVDGGLERANSSYNVGLERAHSGYQSGLDRARHSYSGSVERGKQGLELSMERGLAALHEKLEMLDKGLERIGLERKDDHSPSVDVKKKDIERK